MKPAFVAVFAIVLSVSAHTVLSRPEAASTRDVLAVQSFVPPGQNLLSEQRNSQGAEVKAASALNNWPLYFVENRGQLDSGVRYSTKIKNGTVYFTESEIVWQFLFGDEGRSSAHERPSPANIGSSTGRAPADEPATIREEILRVGLLGANKSARLEGREKQEATFNYFRGTDPEKWVSGARSYQRVAYRDLYPGIDLVVSGREGRMKNEYVVKPGGDPAAIRLKYDGAKGLRVNEKGQLEIRLATGMLVEDVPLSYQIIDGKKRQVATRYRIAGDRTVQFQVEEYSENAELIIDPLTFSTFLGGSGNDECFGIAVDGSGNIYLTGVTSSANFPTTSGVYDTSFNGSADVFITKLHFLGSAILYSTFLGGTGWDEGHGIAVDGSGNAYVTGETSSNNFPTLAAFDAILTGGDDAFVTKLNATGTGLIYSTYLGGSNSESGNGIAVDAGGYAHVVGTTYSNDFPVTLRPHDTTLGGARDAFVTKLGSGGSGLAYSTYLGGSTVEEGQGIAIDGSGNVYVIGFTNSNDFPTTAGAYDTTFNGGVYDAFVTRLIPSSMANLVYSTYLGGSLDDRGYAITIDGSQNAYLTGHTISSDFPTTTGAYDTSSSGTYDVFVAKLGSTGGSLAFSTFLGGSGSEAYDRHGIAIDGDGNVYVVGTTASSDFPTTPGACKTSLSGSTDAFLTKLNASGSALRYSTYIGGSSGEGASGVASDGYVTAYVTGYTSSSDFPTTQGAYDTSYNGGSEGFVAGVRTTTPDIRQPISPISFGNVNVGSTSYMSTTIYNDGDAMLTVNSITRTSGSTDFTYLEPSTPFGVIAGSLADPIISFSPTSGGAKSAVFTVNSNDPDEPDVTFNVSGTGVVPTETISTPAVPSGTSSGYANTSYTYTTGGSTSNLGHDIQYLIDWGDGTDSGWLAVGTTSAQKSWSSAATYAVKAKARCATHTTVESSWSASFSVSIEVREYDNSPSHYQVLPECIWAAASGGGTWVSEVQITDITGGSVVSVYFNYGGGSRRGPFTLWTAPEANQNTKILNILSYIDLLDPETFTYFGKVGAVEFSTQDVSHKIHVTARTMNGNYSKTFPGLNLVDSNTADTAWRMILQNMVNNVTYRSTCGCFNPSAASVTVEFRLLDGNGATIGSPFSRTFAGHDFQSFSPFNQAGIPYPSYAVENAVLWVTPTSGSGKVMVFGSSANNTSNDPAAHIGVQYQGGADNAPSNYQVVPECIWASASGGGTWISEVQVTDITGGSNVSVTFDYGGGARRGPFTIWTSGGANRNIRFANILASIDAADPDAFTYYGKVGAVEFSTQDAAHKIQVLARTLNGNFSKTLPGVNLTDSHTANTWRRMMLQNFVNNATYRSTCGFFNPTADSVTVEFRLVDWMGNTVGSAFTRTLAGHDFQSFSPFTQAGVPYPGYSHDNVVLWITPTSGSGKVMVFGASANNTSNDPAAHIGVQYQ